MLHMETATGRHWAITTFKYFISTAVECKDPGKPTKGGRKPDLVEYVYEDKVEFKCKTNHTLKGNSFIICQQDKSWTGSVPTCLGNITKYVRLRYSST